MNSADRETQSGSPEWFHRSLSTPADRHTVQVDGALINCRVWGTGRSAPIVLLHGSGANSAWWDHIAPYLAVNRLAVAVDLSGHGDSERRDHYDYPIWVDEVRAVVESLGHVGPVDLVGHSFGGAVALAAHHEHPHLFASVTTVDSPLRVMSPSDWNRKTDRATRPLRIYPRREDALRAFRTVPAQPVPEYIRAHIATRSVVQSSSGWTWKFDPQVFNRPQFDPSILRPTSIPVTLIRAESGSMSESTSDAIKLRLGHRARQMCILDAHHHVMLDQPIALIAALQSLTFPQSQRVGV